MKLSFALSTSILVFSSYFYHQAQAQTLLASSLPQCAQNCAQLVNAQSSCTPAGGAPVTNDATYKSCFCQSALLTQLYQPQPVQFCTQCSPQDMLTAQNWYKSFCASGNTNPSASQSGSATAGTQQPSAIFVPPATSTASQVHNQATSAGATVTNQQGATYTDPNAGKSWMQIHWRWIVMIVVLVVGLALFTLIFYVLHRRYHARREKQWSQASVAHPDINTWGPGQSVHDLSSGGGMFAGIKRSLSKNKDRRGGGRGSSEEKQKGKGREATNAGPGVTVPPVPVLSSEKRERYGFNGAGGGQNDGREGPPPQGEGGMF